MFDADSLAGGDSLRPLKMRSWWCPAGVGGGGSVRDAGALTQSPAGKLSSNTDQSFFSAVSLPPCDRGLAVL